MLNSFAFSATTLSLKQVSFAFLVFKKHLLWTQNGMMIFFFPLKNNPKFCLNTFFLKKDVFGNDDDQCDRVML